MDDRSEHERRAGEPAWRGFGRPGDLNIDLGGGARTAVICELLVACLASGENADADARQRHVLRLTLAGRIGALCAVVALTEGTSALDIALRCREDRCAEPFAVELALDELRALADQAERELTVDVALAGGRTLRLRRPTGEDQRTWQRERYPTLGDAQRAIAQSLLEGDRPAPEMLADDALVQIADAMQELDPLPSFRVHCRCVACAADGDHEVDLELALLRRLERRQRGLIDEVHRLAERYGWTEPQVLALPGWRRRAYLDRIEATTA